MDVLIRPHWRMPADLSLFFVALAANPRAPPFLISHLLLVATGTEQQHLRSFHGSPLLKPIIR
ncbi:MAG: hypothetical protein A2672_00985 [Candidatus Wildermuthbacteria bacterium RIFCSPHIGHO2_01_FULL_49_22b]|uniref:Uncharacterized protein n=1 Tax=Candidatus Wildermuthbacteria bacterium RIFCSPHIGHO2_01_FULL_49_22b TaxID=1802448 RepID=A0A1G2QX61_9BACT|nr:MAG: hypothetical protein A2672_00985 [Candidatus Wildermuthbacteria bacterium RIFCSPHIGHO2_01_FULL_49_22b]